MPLFASFDSIYTEPTSDALPEFSLTLHEQNPNSLHEQNPNSIHDKLIEFDTSGIPEIILATEPDALTNYNPGRGAVHPDMPMDTHPNDILLGFPGSGADDLAREDDPMLMPKGTRGENYCTGYCFDGGTTENIGGASGPGGTTFMTGYTNGTICEGMDSTTEVIDVMNNFTNFAMPVGDFI